MIMGAKPKVLFICVHNSARSQMAEAYLRRMGEDRFEVASAGFRPTRVNPLVVEVMREEGFELDGKPTQGVFDLYKGGKLYDYVITVCQEAEAEGCPTFPGVTKRLHWPFADPSAFEGTHEEKLAQTRVIRDRIKEQVTGWVKEIDAELTAKGI